MSHSEPENRRGRGVLIDVLGAIVFLATVVLLVYSLVTMDRPQSAGGPHGGLPAQQAGGPAAGLPHPPR